MSALAKVLGLLVALVVMASTGRTPAEALAEIKTRAGDFWPHLLPLLQAEGLDRAAGLVVGITDHRMWFDALAAEISGNGKKKNGRATASTKRKPATAKPAAGKARAPAGRSGRGTGNA